MTTETKRDALFDNLKGLLIFLVVFGHLIQFARGKTDPWIGYLYTSIYLVHMPLFVFISGYFSKRIRWKRTLELLMVYALWQMILSPLILALTTDQSYFELLTPIWSPTNHHWYLVSLVFWRLLLPLATRIRGVLWWSFGIGVFSGLCPVITSFSPANADLSFLSIPRTLGFFPFFLMGYFFTPEQINHLRQRLHPVVAGLLFCLLAFIGWWGLQDHVDAFIKPSMINKILFMREGYMAFLTKPQMGIVFRTCLYGLQILLVFLAICACPRTPTPFQLFGIHSFFIFLSHCPLIFAFKFNYLDQQIKLNPWFVFIGGILLTWAYIGLCCTPWVTRWSHYVTTLPTFNHHPSNPKSSSASEN